jgi:hypothetical protein
MIQMTSPTSSDINPINITGDKPPAWVQTEINSIAKIIGENLPEISSEDCVRAAEQVWKVYVMCVIVNVFSGVQPGDFSSERRTFAPDT